VVDHIRAFISKTPGFDRLAVTGDKIRHSRIPATDAEVHEVILGKFTPREFLKATDWVRSMQRKTEEA
jgi:hypothetical protein